MGSVLLNVYLDMLFLVCDYAFCIGFDRIKLTMSLPALQNERSVARRTSTWS